VTIRFEHPAWFLLLLLCIPMAVAIVRWCSAMSLLRRWSAVLTRVALVGLIAGTLAGATGIRTSQRLAVIAVVDVSGSVQRFADLGPGPDGRPITALEGVRRLLQRATAARGPEDLLGLVIFDGEALALASPTRVNILDRPLDVTMQEGSDIAQAIRLARAMIPPDAAGRIALFSDGNQNAGDAVEASRELAGVGSSPSAALPALSAPRIDVVPLAYNVQREVIVESIDVPPQAIAESTIPVRITLEAAADASGTLQLLREGTPVDINGREPGMGLRLALRPGRHVEVLSVRLEPGRIHRFEAVFEPDPMRAADGTGGGDTITTNNRAEAVTLTPGRASVLIVAAPAAAEGDGALGQLPDVLRDAGFDVDVVAPSGVPGDLLSLQAYDVVILVDIPAEEINRQTHAALAGFVSDLGGGLVMVGGRSSFAAGGWKGTAIEPILPVSLDLPEKLIVPAAAIVIVLDNSGSMNRTVLGSTRSQQQIANEGAALAVQTMDKTDLLGVITFNQDYTVQIPLARNSDPRAAAERIRSITADGGTNLPPALEAAHRQLRDVQADVRHVIVLSDGVSMGKEQLPGIAKAMHDDGISVTAIAVGDGADTRGLAELATTGGGQYYRVTDPNTLPRIFIKAVRVVRSPMVREAPFTPVLLGTGSPLVEGLSGDAGDGEIPQLGGISLTQPRREATVVNAMAHPMGEPLLAHWSVGLGRAAAFTSDAGRWARRWLDWPGYRQLWTLVARSIARPRADRSQELSLELVGDELRVRLDAAGEDGKPLDLLTVPASIYTPGGDRLSITLSQTGPGAYEGAAPARATGNYVVTLTPRQGSRLLPPVIGGVSRATGVEFRRLRSNIALLEEIARITGGRIFDIRDALVEPGPSGAPSGDAAAATAPAAPDVAGARSVPNLFDRTGIRPTEARLPLWRTLVFWALVALLLDVATRRIAWDRFFSREFGAALRREAAEALKDRGDQSARALARLRRRAPAPQPAGAEGESRLLSTDDARRIVREQAERRRLARAARPEPVRPDAIPGAPASTATAPGAKPAPKSTDAAPAEPAPQEHEPAAGLMAAKLRARQRMQSQADDGDSPPSA
jgi:uncharacterized membrane protein